MSEQAVAPAKKSPWWIAFRSRKTPDYFHKDEAEREKTGPVLRIQRAPTTGEGESRKVYLNLFEMDTFLAADGSLVEEGSSDDFLGSFPCTVTCEGKNEEGRLTWAIKVDGDPVLPQHANPGPPVSVRFVGEKGELSDFHDISLGGDDVEEEGEWELGWSITKEPPSPSSAVCQSKSPHLIRCPDWRSFWDFRWEMADEGGARLRVRTRFPDGTPAKVTVYRWEDALPSRFPFSEGELERPEKIVELATLEGEIKDGECTALWEHPEETDPFRALDWLVDYGDSGLTLDEIYEAPGVHPPVFSVEAEEEWAFSGTPGLAANRIPAAGDGLGNEELMAITVDGTLVELVKDEEGAGEKQPVIWNLQYFDEEATA